VARPRAGRYQRLNPTLSPVLQLGLHDDAFARAFFNRLGHGLFECRTHRYHLRASAGGVQNRVALLDVGQAIIEEGEHLGADFFAKTISRAEFLVDPHLHSVHSSRSVDPRRTQVGTFR